MNEEQKAKVISAVWGASERWQNAFNAGDAAGCSEQYEATAVMQADPFGTFEGTESIRAFWQQLVDDGFSDVEYLEPQLEVVDERSAVLSSGWRMNKARGVIHRELWVIQDDGTAKLREDHFEAQG